MRSNYEILDIYVWLMQSQLGNKYSESVRLFSAQLAHFKSFIFFLGNWNIPISKRKQSRVTKCEKNTRKLSLSLSWTEEMQ